MITLLFCILMFTVFGKLAVLALKAAWGITKILLCFVLAPLILLAIVFSGFIYIAMFLLIIGGVMSLVESRVIRDV